VDSLHHLVDHFIAGEAQRPLPKGFEKLWCPLHGLQLFVCSHATRDSRCGQIGGALSSCIVASCCSIGKVEYDFEAEIIKHSLSEVPAAQGRSSCSVIQDFVCVFWTAGCFGGSPELHAV
jgi:hypothetical protein